MVASKSPRDVLLSTDAERLDSAMDRVQEAHFFLHGMEASYHSADAFRWDLNAFLRSIKEVPQLTAMALQNVPGFSEWFRPRREALSDDRLIAYLSKQRDFVVHRGMLRPSSTATVGLTDGRNIRLGVTMPIDPLLDSDEAMRRIVCGFKDRKDDFLGLLMDDEDTIPCIDRRWALQEFGDVNLVDLCATAWLKVATLLKEAYGFTGVALDEPALPCRHASEDIRRRVYPRERLKAGDFCGQVLR